MKKIGTIILVLSFFLIHSYAHATSGACSYHGGVDCSVGASWDGNAMCNDGTESSVSYSSMDECINTAPSCTISQDVWNLAKSNADALTNLMSSESNQYQSSMTEIESGTYPLTASQQAQIDSTSQAFNQETNQEQLRLAALSSETGGVSNQSGQSGQMVATQSNQTYAIAQLENGFMQEDGQELTTSYTEQLDREKTLLQKLQNALSCSILQPISTSTSVITEPLPCPAGYTCSSVNSPTPVVTPTITTAPAPIQYTTPKIIKKKPSTISIQATTTTSIATTSNVPLSQQQLQQMSAGMLSTSTLLSSSTININTTVKKSWYSKLYDYLFNIL